MVSPLISIIMATYNRSNVLRYSIESVLRQTVSDWELLVVGDACTDDTEQVVASFQDPRIHFFNLERNVGEQSGPNNEGFQRSRGRYIAYLNHDDLWFPDHLETALHGLQETGADLVFTLMDIIQRNKLNRLSNAIGSGKYEPYALVPASSWLLKRALQEEIGPWRLSRACYNTPSQDWLFRAWKAGKDLRLIPKLTAIAIISGYRKGVYANRDYQENEEYFQKMLQDPTFREQELAEIAVGHALHDAKFHSNIAVGIFFWQGIKNLVKKLSLFLGIHPFAFHNFFVVPGKGGWIRKFRKLRGLDEQTDKTNSTDHGKLAASWSNSGPTEHHRGLADSPPKSN